jgi:hypothetical protein
MMAICWRAMAARAIEGEIDRLYQLPPEEFTAARNALAKGAGADAARIRALTKPPIGAWAVNQLYREDADTWNALIEASENARRAHRAVLSGKNADVRAANKVHDEAADRALKATLALLARAGHPATDATKHAIGTTLRALPAEDAPGRLTRMLQPAGFETLAGLSVMAGADRPAKAAKAASTPPARPASPAAERPVRSKADVKALTQARQEAAASARALRDAENAARREEFERVRTEREETRAADAAEKAREAAARAAEELEQAEAAAATAVDARKQAATRARESQQEVTAARKHADTAAKQVAALEKSGSGRR